MNVHYIYSVSQRNLNILIKQLESCETAQNTTSNLLRVNHLGSLICFTPGLTALAAELETPRWPCMLRDDVQAGMLSQLLAFEQLNAFIFNTNNSLNVF